MDLSTVPHLIQGAPLRESDLKALAASLQGEVISGDRGAPVFNARYADAKPIAIVRCATPEDVIETVAFLRRHQSKVAIRSGGHSFAGHSSTDGVVIDVTDLSSISSSGRIATIGAGARLGPIYDALERDGLTIPAGTCPTVGIAGLTLGGGLGILGRRYGVTSDRLIAASIVLADGRLVECDSGREPDLFWALRGGGAGNFGVVTELVFDTVPIPTAANVHVNWPFSTVEDVIAAWQAWAPHTDQGMTASLKVTFGGSKGETPSVDLYGVWQGPGEEAHDLVTQLVDQAGEPAAVQVDPMSYAQVRKYWETLGAEPDESDDTPPPSFVYIKSEYFDRPLPHDVIAGLISHFAAGASFGRELDFIPWGGAYNQTPWDATAFVHREALFQVKHSAEIPSDAPETDRENADRWVKRSRQTIHGHGSGGVFPNFPDPDLVDAPSAYYGANLPRLAVIKGQYDPDDFFSGPQTVGP